MNLKKVIIANICLFVTIFSLGLVDVSASENINGLNFTWEDPTNIERNDQMFDMYDNYGIYLKPSSSVVESGDVTTSKIDKYYHFSNQDPRNIKVRYTDVATYRNQKLDIILSFTDYVIEDESNYDVAIDPHNLAFNISGLSNVEFNFKVVKSGTDQAIPITFILKVTDIDGQQYIGLPKNEQKNLMITENSLLKYAEYENYSIFGNLNRGTEYDDYYDTLIYANKADEISGVWGTEYSKPKREYVKFDIRLAPEPDTLISKKVIDDDENDLAEIGEKINYEIDVKNTSNYVEAIDVPIRDSLIENTPEYLSYNNDLKISPNVNTSGDLAKGDFMIDEIKPKQTIRLSYSMTLKSVPNDVGQLENIATDNGQMPDVCEDASVEVDCDSTLIPINPDPIISKEVKDENNNGIVELNEDLKYHITVYNPNLLVSAYNVYVRDSLLENTPRYLQFNNDLKVTPQHIKTHGDMQKGDFMIEEIPANSQVDITYSMKLIEIPDNIDNIENLATTNPEIPEECLEDQTDCAETITPIEPETIISKEVKDENNNNVAELNEKLTYIIKVQNPSTINAYDVNVRDNMLENLPKYLTYNNDLEVFGSNYTGDIKNGSFVLEQVSAKDTVEIKYSVTVNSLPSKIDKITNIASDDGKLHNTCESELVNVDCDVAEIPLNTETLISKDVQNNNGNKLVEVGDDSLYTITVKNENSRNAYNVPVRDSMLEDTPDYLKYNEDISVEGSDYSGSLQTGDFILDSVPANSTVKITYSMQLVKDIDGEEIVNIATDNNSNPDVCTKELEGIDCASTKTISKPTPITNDGNETNDINNDKPSLKNTGRNITFAVIGSVSFAILISLIIRRKLK